MNLINNANSSGNFAIRRIRERLAGKLIPFEVLVEVTEKCNLNCVHCAVEPLGHAAQPDELSFSEITRVLDQLFQYGILAVTFTGGEPLSRPDILEIMNYAKERGLFFGLKTNGTLITEKLADNLKSLDVTGIHVSLYGANRSTHENVTGVPGSYDRTIKAIKLLRDRAIRVAIKTTIMKCNVEENMELGELAREMGVPYRADPLVFPKVGQPGSANDFRVDDEQLSRFIKEQNWINMDFEFQETGPECHLLCGGGSSRCAISSQGEIFPCALWRLPLGDLRKQSFESIWYGEAVQKIRDIKVNDMPDCTSCELLKYCTRCPGLVYIENSGVSGPSSENCRLARAVKGVKDERSQEALY